MKPQQPPAKAAVNNSVLKIAAANCAARLNGDPITVTTAQERGEYFLKVRAELTACIDDKERNILTEEYNALNADLFTGKVK